jgi:hypothetical protein
MGGFFRDRIPYSEWTRFLLHRGIKPDTPEWWAHRFLLDALEAEQAEYESKSRE